MISRYLIALALLLTAQGGMAATTPKKEAPIDAAQRAYDASDYPKAVQLLQVMAANNPQNGDTQLLLAMSYHEMDQRDAAIASAEKAVAIDPKNSVYHEWLGRTYGEKADHSSWFTAMSFAKKTRKEFEISVQLDKKNFAAWQVLIEFDCSAPGIVGGGDDKAHAETEELAAMDAAEGHYATGNCRREKKDFATADAEFTKALDAHPKSANLIYDIGDYAVKRSQPERLETVADWGESVSPADPRAKFYRGVALVLKKTDPKAAEQLLREYVKVAPIRDGYPRPAAGHLWLGKLFESQNKLDEARSEYQTAVKMDPKNKIAQESLKSLKKN